MKVEILFDKEAMNKDIRIGWGVSFLINQRILFDTGESGRWLLENMRNLRGNGSQFYRRPLKYGHIIFC